MSSFIFGQLILKIPQFFTLWYQPLLSVKLPIFQEDKTLWQLFLPHMDKLNRMWILSEESREYIKVIDMGGVFVAKIALNTEFIFFKAKRTCFRKWNKPHRYLYWLKSSSFINLRIFIYLLFFLQDSFINYHTYHTRPFQFLHHSHWNEYITL